ncbi:MAG: TonB-dependent receptor [Methylococcaceae bacterium]|nr:MAG: TonB-dependent receptor [Methylococcaceae bacterium]
MCAGAEALSEDEQALLEIYGAKEMISIATGTKQLIGKAPAVASVITAEDIKAIGATDIDEVLETVPGLHVSRSALVGYNPIYTFRGVNSLLNPQVLMLINGIPITNSYQGDRNLIWGGMPVQAIARIEVVRGPGSAVYGADAAAGVINIITKTKQDIRGNEVGGRVGSFNTYDGWALHGDTWAGFDVVAMVEYHNTDGQRRIIDADTQTMLDSALGTQASLAPGPVTLTRDNLDVRIDLSRENWRLRAGVQRRQNLGLGVGMAQALTPDARFASDRWNTDLTYHNAKFTDNWDVQGQLSYLDTTYEGENNYNRLLPPGTLLPIGADGQLNFSSPQQMVVFPGGYSGNPGVFERHARFNLSGTYAGIESHLFRIGSGFNYDVIYKTTEVKNFGLDPGTGNAIPFSNSFGLVDVSDTAEVFMTHPDRKNLFAYVQDEWKFAKDWQLTLGARYDYFSDFGDTINPRVALIWDPTYDITAKLLYGSAYRAPSFAEMYNKKNPPAVGNTDLQPETMDTTELAFDYRPRDDLRLGWNLFYYWWKDIIRYVPDGSNNVAQNTGTQTGYGSELEAEWKAGDTLKLTGNYAWQQATDDTFDHVAGNSPRHQVYFRADWEFMPQWHFSPQIKWIVGRDRVFGDNRPSIADYALTDLTLRRQHLAQHWEVAFSVRNLFDVDAREPSQAGNPTASITNDLPLAGRTVYGEIRFNF